MDFVKKAMSGGSNNNNNNDNTRPSESSSGSGGGGGGFMDKLNSAAGGGAQGEKNEDALDKAVDMFQEKVLGQGPQDNESAAEQAKDEMISDGIRDQYKKFTGSDFPIEDKDRKVGF